MERENEFFNLDEALVDFAEMNGFDFVSGRYISNNEAIEVAKAVKQSGFDFIQIIKNLFQPEKQTAK